MENLNNVNWKERQRELMGSLNENLDPIDRYSTVWIEYTRLHSVCITLFKNELVTRGGNSGWEKIYHMYFAKNVTDFSVENLKSIVLSQIEN